MVTEKIKENMNYLDNITNSYAMKNTNARRIVEEVEDMRPPFFRDSDRIIHSPAFARYQDKTQVFTHPENDHVTTRMIHVQLVSKIARTIGRALGLNEDLIEAAGLGHDLGHTPYGHTGEYILNDLSKEHGGPYFNHNIQSVRLLMYVENKGKGLNLNIQTLDAIMCHNGEFLLGKYEPMNKTIEEILEEYEKSYYDDSVIKKMRPMTLEGCVVRISDMIAYLGRDYEDAIEIGAIDEEIPENISSVLGKNNREVVNTIILDIINNSIDKEYLELSPEIYYAIKEFKDFNYKNIYNKSLKSSEHIILKEKFIALFNEFLDDLKNNNQDSEIFEEFINKKIPEYHTNSSDIQIVLDYISGMTDDFFQKRYENIIKKRN